MKEFRPQVMKFNFADKYQRLFSPETQTTGIKAGLVNLKPQEEIGEHSTENKEEVIVVLAGTLEFFSDKEAKALKVEANSAIYVPVQTKHNLKNIGPILASYVFITKS